MQDAFTGAGWVRQPSFSPEVLAPLHELNVRFLDLIATRSACLRFCGEADPFQGAPRPVAPMSALQRAAAARCPYSLFDLRFNDEDHWHERLNGAGPWRIAEETAPGTAATRTETAAEDTENFVRLALFYAWHVASTSRHAARVLLGMSERTVGEFRAATLACLPPLVGSEARHLTARFRDCGAYWSALSAAAARTDAHRLRRIQLFGLQLAAASLLP